MHEDPIDRGLAAAFGPEASSPHQSSVLRALQARADSRLGLHLDALEPDEDLIRVTEEARRLRDPSGRYQVLGEIGRGGVGTVYKGRDLDLGRDVAMKVLRGEHADHPDVLARFVEEAQIGGQLQHPGIVPVYELGLQESGSGATKPVAERPYFTMKLVKGETLARHLARRESCTEDRRRLLGVFEQVCQTIAYAHARRVVHRDLKPANIMIGAFGEVQVVDWGFAKVLPKGGIVDEAESVARQRERSVIETVRSKEGSASVAGSMLGTPAYLPPEQALGDVERVDERSDVFALGAILCEVLTGWPPYLEADGDLVRQAAAAALEGAHRRLDECGADPSIVALCKECMAPARRARPESAGEVAERAGVYLTSVEERARQAEVRAAEARYRQRVTLLSSVTGVAILVLGAGTWIWVQSEARTRRAEATQLVASALHRANGARGQAQEAGLDLTLWDVAEASARQAADLASSQDVEVHARAEARDLLAELTQQRVDARAVAAQEQRDEDMLERLVDLRIPVDDSVTVPDWRLRESRRLDAAYGDAFAEYLDAPLFELPAEEALAGLAAGAFPTELATSLDHWGLVRDALTEDENPPDAGDTARIRELAGELDAEDPWRSELRALLPSAASERERLESLAERADFAALSAAGCRVLSDALLVAGSKESGGETLLRAREVHPRDFDLCFRLAVVLEFLGAARWEGALQTYRIANALRPDRLEVLHRQGMVFERLERHAEAERVFRRLDTRQPDSAHWLRHLGDAVTKQDRIEEALPIYDRALEIAPRDSMVLNQKGRALEGLGKRSEAFACYEAAIGIDPRDGEAQSNLGNLLMHQGELAEAEQHHRLALSVDPEDPRFLNNLAVVLDELERFDEAAECYEQALAIDPEHPSALSNYTELLAREGRSEEAIACLRRALSKNPDDTNLHCALADRLDDGGDREAALREYLLAVECDDQNATAHSNLGHLLLKGGEQERAVQHFRLAVAAGPKNAIARFNLGRGLQVGGHLEEAESCYEQAILLDPDQPSVYLNLTAVLVSNGDTDAAIACGESAVARFPALGSVHANLGSALAQAGRLDDAISECLTAVELDPTLVDAHSGLCFFFGQRDQLDAAIEHGRQAIKHGPEHLGAHLNLGHALHMGEHLTEALQCFEQAARIAPDSSLAYQNLASTLLDLGPEHIEEAMAHARRALELDARNTGALFCLGIGSTRLGRLEEALSMYRAAIAIDAAVEPEVAPAIRAIERRLAERPALLAIASGDRPAGSAAEWAEAVYTAYEEQMHAQAVALTEATLRDSPQWVDAREWGLYSAACSAALLAADPQAALEREERSRVRGLSRAWLARQVEAWSRWVAADDGSAANGREFLEHALNDPDFVSVRGEPANELPAGERAAWEELWSRIQGSLEDEER